MSKLLAVIQCEPNKAVNPTSLLCYSSLIYVNKSLRKLISFSFIYFASDIILISFSARVEAKFRGEKTRPAILHGRFLNKPG